MELSILDSSGLPEGSILSVRSGPTRRQSPLPCCAPFKLPAGPWPLRIDVLALLGKSGAGASLAIFDAQGCTTVPLEARDGRRMSVTLQVFDSKSGMRPKTAPDAAANRKDVEEPDAEASPSAPPARRRDTEAEARAYLDRHRLHEFMHALFELLLRERPEDPYSFIAARFNEAAQLEPRKAPNEMHIIDKHEKVPRSLVSTAPTSAPTVKSEEPPACVVPEGSMQVVVRNLRGRSLARLVVRADDKIVALKERLEASLGIPVAAQQLLWWAETLPNDTTLADHGVDRGTDIHLACATRDPRVKLVLSGSSDGGMRLWNMRDGEILRDFGSGGPSAVLAMAVSWDTMRALAGCFDGSLQLWDLKSGQMTKVIEAHAEEVNVVEADWPSMRAITGASDATAKVWNLEDGSCLQTLQAGSTVYTLAVDWSKMRVCGGLSSGLVRLWDVSTGAKIRDFGGAAAAAQASHTAVSAVAIDVLGMRAVSGLEDGHLLYWHFHRVDKDRPSSDNLGAGSSSEASTKPPKPKALLAHYCAIRTISARWRPEGSQALCGSDDGSLSLWRVDTSECLARFARHVGYVWTVYADWSRGRALSGAFDGCFKLWDLRNGDCLRTVQSHCRPVRSICGA